MGRPKVVVCGEDGCAGDAGQLEQVVATLSEVADVEVVGCQDFCAGPVVGVTKDDGGVEWYLAAKPDHLVRVLGTSSTG